ncbi:transcriptional regulator, GntR family [Austwickia chelonae]|uniref:Putative GntR family transcriptional regulator n=1 Tax=Austwickia chelonae NBRC 105200 TaxID=1184607 RepID=K6WA73_9MICO|nr:FCD domain-containing protein [Austwickia chelonae]GAB78737.1 putative GntR family transcriptional regulator [Austwickia chelonae NBRC 105200]SEW35161.1 transcriptional regulator, GntR family [Austwickia chelonae]
MAIADRRSSTWSTADGIKAYIIEYGLRPGDLMPTEADLCVALGVSRSSVREAVRTLASLDIVEVRHGHGTYVGQMSLAPLVNGLVFRLSLDAEQTLNSLRDVVHTRMALDLTVADELIARNHGKYRRELHSLLDEMERRGAAGGEFMEEDFAFHALLFKDVDNTIMGELASAFLEIYTRALPQLGVTPQEDIAQTVRTHHDMLRALETGDVDGYRAAVRAHYAPLQRAIERAVEAQTPPAEDPS